VPRFAYEALDAEGRIIQGVVEAPTVEAVIEDLRNIRYTVTNVKEQADLFAYFRLLRVRLMRVNLWAMVLFTRQFATLFNSGVPLLRGFEGLVKQTTNRRLQMALRDVHNDIRSGATIARAMAKHPDVFTPVYIALVRAGEMAGALGEILDRTATFLEKDYKLRKKVQSATTYPLLVFIIAIIITTVMVIYVFPTFTSLLDGLNVPLPWPTRLLIFVTEFARSPTCAVLVFVVVPVCIYLFTRYIKTKQGKYNWDRFLIEVPVIGLINRKVVISRFCRTLSTLLASGVPMLHALEIVSKVSGNEVVAEILDEIRRAVKGGMRLSAPLREYHLFPPIVPHMVNVGEETGNLPEILIKVANFYDTEIEALLSQFATLIEPFMISFMGLMVLFILLAVFLPVYQILQNLG
jgi:type IV pilus assembly protein PilC